MDADACEVGQDANRLRRLAAPLGMDRIVRQPVRARPTSHVRPGQCPRAAHIRFIAVQYRHPLQRLLETRFHRGQCLGAVLDPLHERARRE